MSSSTSFRAGFNLIELVVSIAILGLLIVVTTMSINYPRIREYADDTKRKADVAYIANVLSYYYSEEKNYPSIALWRTITCKNSLPLFIQKYTTEIPCDPSSNAPYYYEPTNINGYGSVDPLGHFAGFRILTRLHNLKDSSIRVAGCDPSGCGVYLKNEANPNYGVAIGTRVPAPGFIPIQESY